MCFWKITAPIVLYVAYASLLLRKSLRARGRICTVCHDVAGPHRGHRARASPPTQHPPPLRGGFHSIFSHPPGERNLGWLRFLRFREPSIVAPLFASMKFRRLLFLLMALLLFGCAGRRKAHHPPAAPVGPQVVGKVAIINLKSHFVLLDVGSLYTPASGSTLKCYAGETETGELLVSPERKRPFIAADIVKGEPKVGDRVEE